MKNNTLKLKYKQATEHQLQSQCIKYFRMQYKNSIITAIPNAGKRSIVEGARMKAEGLLTGFPDTQILHNGKMVFIEFKVGRNKLTEAQYRVQQDILANGFPYYVCYSFDEFLNILKLELV